jgi:predicted CxxxxCH...CXXCH cytochrome family protein
MGNIIMNRKNTMHRQLPISLAFLSALSLSLLLQGGLLQPQEAASATITCSSGLSGCHFSGSVTDGTNRNVPSGQFTGSHAKHSGAAANQYAYACTHCHPSGSYTNSHQTGYKNITGSSLSGTSYNQGKKIELSFQNNPTMGTCSASYCHGTAASDAWGTPGPLACNKCHAANNSLPGAHGIHYASTSLPKSFSTYSGNVSTASTYKFGCGSCHSAAKGAQHANGTANANGAAQVFYGFTSATMKGGTYAYGTLQGNDNGFKWSNGSANCNTTYCHSNGQNANGLAIVAWSTTASTGTCVQCHDTKKSSGASGLTALHDKHMNPSQNTVLGTGNGFNCADCHAKTITNTNNLTLADKTKHINKFKEFSSPKGGGSAKYNVSTKQCTNIYCHSNGNPNNLVYVNPTAWNVGTPMGCNGCHGTSNSYGYPDYANGGAGTNTANLHAGHMAGMTSTTACADCHRKTPDGTVSGQFRAYSSLHMSGSPNVYFNTAKNYIGSAAQAYGTAGAGKCSKIVCHGAGTPQWGANTSANTCQKCHGSISTAFATVTSAQVAPGYGADGKDTGGNTAATAARVGAHQIHLTTQLISGPVKCSECHLKVATIRDGNHWNYSTATLTFTGRAVSGGHTTPSVSRGANGVITCSSLYCHTGKYDTGAAMTPAWNNTGYLSASIDIASCKQCHNMPPATSDHSGIANLTAFPANTCSCHTNLNSGSGPTYANIFVDKTLHLNGTINYVSSCTGCHAAAVGGNPSPSGSRRQVAASGANNGEFTVASATKYTNMTSHIKTTAVSDYSCQFCHAQSSHKTYSDGKSVLLQNTWAAGTITYTGTAASLTYFCTGCHRSAGYGGTIPSGAIGTANQPYKDSTGNTATPDNIFADWSSAGQFTGTSAEPTALTTTGNTTVRYTHRKSAQCMDCHGDNQTDSTTTPRINAHASKNGSFLRFSTNKSVQTPIGDGTTNTKARSEAQTCFNKSTGCHGPGSTLWAGASVYDEFTVNNPSRGTGGAHPILQAVTPKSTRISSDTAGANFVNGWKSDSIATCSDCHGGSPTGPRGPHGSTLPFIIKPAPSTSPTKTTSGTNFTAVTQNPRAFCLNCHAAYVYGDGNGNPGANGGTRVGHGSGKAWSGNSNCSGPAKSYMNNSCQNCHCGRGFDEVSGTGKGTHSTNATVGGSGASGVGFCNGNNWSGGPLNTGSTGGCYVNGDTNPNYATCTKSAGHFSSDHRFKKNIGGIMEPLRALFAVELSRYASDRNIPVLVDTIKGQQRLIEGQQQDIMEIRSMIREMNR